MPRVGLVAATVLLALLSCTPDLGFDTFIRGEVEGRTCHFFHPVSTLEMVNNTINVQGWHGMRIEPWTEELLAVSIPVPRKGEQWPLRSSAYRAYASFFVRNSRTDNIEAFHTDEQHRGTLEVTYFDPQLQIVEGRFEFVAFIANRKGPRHYADTLRVRNGEFRARYTVVPADAYDHPDRD